MNVCDNSLRTTHGGSEIETGRRDEFDRFRFGRRRVGGADPRNVDDAAQLGALGQPLRRPRPQHPRTCVAGPPSATEYKEYAGRCHFPGQDGWEEVADFVLAWATEHATRAAAEPA
jgi:hypothetical protein